jgi:hypothetical protein
MDVSAVLSDCALVDAAAEYVQLRERIRRAIAAGKLEERIVPNAYMAWAEENGAPLPDDLRRSVEARNATPNWKVMYDDLFRKYEELSKERDFVKGELDKARRDTLTGKERTSAKRLIIGMAVAKWKYDPRLERNKATQEIANELHLLGIDLDVDTVRKWLQESAEELPQD